MSNDIQPVIRINGTVQPGLLALGAALNHARLIPRVWALAEPVARRFTPARTSCISAVSDRHGNGIGAYEAMSGGKMLHPNLARSLTIRRVRAENRLGV